MAHVEIHIISDKGNRSIFRHGEPETFSTVTNIMSGQENVNRYSALLDEEMVLRLTAQDGDNIPSAFDKYNETN